jgi:hypothetical protein
MQLQRAPGSRKELGQMPNLMRTAQQQITLAADFAAALVVVAAVDFN